MPEKPVAKLALDTRAHGPYFCKGCDEENEDALLMSDGTVVCPECEEPMPEFQPFTDVITSASPIASSKAPKAKKGKWVIEWTGPDSSRDDATVAYDSQEEAFEAAMDWIGQHADDELNGFTWDEGDEQPEYLKDIIRDVNEQNPKDAILKWLEYQQEFDPQEKMAIGPSGFVSKSPHDFKY